MAKLTLGVMISGRGSNLQALINACRDHAFPARIGLVISNVAGVAGLARAAAAGIPTEVVDHRVYDGRPAFEDRLHATLEHAGVDLVCLAGFMRLLGEHFLGRWPDRVINIHPSLLPAFRGLHVHERVLASGVRFSGCTVHFVRPAMDDGPIIVQAAVPVHIDDTPEALAARILKQEHRILPWAVRLIAEGRVRIDGERVIIAEGRSPPGELLNPLPD